MRWILLMVACLLAGLSANAAQRPLNELRLDVWTVDRGLPHNTVLSLAQTADGYLWIGTWEGLVRFDGAHFGQLSESTPLALREAGILALAAAADGSLWIGTHGGGIYQHRQGRYRVVSKPGVDLREHVITLLVTRAGVVYAGTSNGSVLRVDDAGFTLLARDPARAHGSVLALSEDRDGRILAAADSGLYRVSGDRLQAIEVDWPGAVARTSRLTARAAGGWWLATSSGLLQLDADLVQVHAQAFTSPITRVLEDADGTLWLGADPLGLVRIEADATAVLGRVDGLPNARVASMLRDHEGNLWAGTNGGLVRLNAAPFSAITERQGLADPFVRTLLQRADDSLVVGGPGGLDVLRGGRLLDPRPLWPEALAGMSVLALAEAPDGRLLVGSSAAGAFEWGAGGLRQRVAPEQLGSNQVRAILADADGGVWYGTIQGLSRCLGDACRRYSRSDGIEGDYITALARDRDGTLWIGSSMGVTRSRDGGFEKIAMEQGAAHTVFAFLHDHLGRHWVATDGGLGLLRDGRFMLIDSTRGLLDDAIFSVLEDAAGQLWVSGNRGVLRIDPEAAEAVYAGRQARLVGRQFGRADGLPSSQANGGSQPAAIRDRAGRLWFATAGGVAMIDPADPIVDAPPPPPRVAIEAVLVDGIENERADLVRLQPDQRRLQIRFAGISFAAPGRLQLRYRLLGFDNQWQAADSERSANYTNLAPGQYRFEVEAGWRDAPAAGGGIGLDVAVLAAWHQRLSVRIAAGAGLLALLALLGWLRLRGLRLRERELEREVARKTHDLTAERDALAQANRRNVELAGQLGRQAREDPLTGLANRRHADRELAAAIQPGAQLTLALLDIDHFKAINDQHGHASGDRVLQQFAATLRETLVGTSLIARVGGEEFLVLWPGHDSAAAVAQLGRLRQRLQQIDWASLAPGLVLRFSAGLTVNRADDSIDACYRRADQALYRAKHAGRDRIQLAADPQ